MVIKFFYENQKHGEFSNFFVSPIKVKIFSELDRDGIPIEGSASLGEFEFPTAEHLFQALKFSQGGGRTHFKAVIEEATAEGAKKVAGERKTRVRND